MIFARVQWKSLQSSVDEAAKARSAQVLLKIFSIMAELRPKWHKLYKLPSDFATWNNEQCQLADHVATELQRVAYLCEKKLIDPEFVMDGYGKVFIQCWDKLANYIKDYRVQCGEPAELYTGGYQRKHFERFTRKCRQFHPGIKAARD